MLLKLALVFLLSARLLVVCWLIALVCAVKLGAWVHLLLVLAVMMFPVGCVLLIVHLVTRSQQRQHSLPR